MAKKYTDLQKKRLEKAYNRYGLKEYPQTILKVMQKQNPQQYEKYIKRQELILKGKYNTYRREVFLKNLIDTLEEKKQLYGDESILDINETHPLVTQNDTIDTIIEELKTIRLSDFDYIGGNIKLFIENYDENNQNISDKNTMVDMLATIRNFKKGNQYKPRKSFKYTTI